MCPSKPALPALPHKNLIFDADDTLWQNNVYFVDATEAFLDIMESKRLNRTSVRTHLTETERRVVAEYGYGTSGFIRSLSHTARDLLPDVAPGDIEQIEDLGHKILQRTEVDLLPGVEAAISHLASHNHLFLLTKGDDFEQRAKLEASRLVGYFRHVEVAREKDEATYRDLVTRLDLDPALTWMIGNSPRSDVNPALAAGLNAVLIPHPQTWEMELEDLTDPGGGRLSIVESVTDLISVFAPVQP